MTRRGFHGLVHCQDVEGSAGARCALSLSRAACATVPVWLQGVAEDARQSESVSAQLVNVISMNVV